MKQEEILSLKTQHGDIYRTDIESQAYIWRRLTKAEFNMIDQLGEEDEDKEDLIVNMCLIYPRHLDYDECHAGVPVVLANEILTHSGFVDETSAAILAEHRAEMQNLETQMEAIIHKAFPSISLEEIESWDVPKTLKYYSRAEWILEILEGIPITQILEKLHESDDGLVSGSMEDFPELMAEQHNQRGEKMV